MKALIIDDNPDVASTTAIMFETLGCETQTETKAQNAFDKAKTMDPDIIIMDIGMPFLNGYELCQTLREKGFEKTYIVAHTGWGSVEDKKKALNASFNEVLVKPASMEQYQDILNQVKNR